MYPYFIYLIFELLMHNYKLTTSCSYIIVQCFANSVTGATNSGLVLCAGLSE